ncbi:MAG: type VI secretion system contractile sheath large subunit [Gammaproteobacteria bacterium]|nr:type VI secretion system contractile sheath large subunit [Gammaproteobacteria bacterium]
MPGKIDFNFNLGTAPRARSRETDRMRILVMGDFTGSELSRDDLKRHAILRVDWDNFDEVLARFAPTIRLGEVADEILKIGGLNDFDPDKLFASNKLFEKFRDLRARLSNSATFEAAAAEIRDPQGLTEDAPQDDHATQPEAGDSNELARLLQEDTKPVARRSMIDELLRVAVQDHIVAGQNPEQETMVEWLDQQISVLMRVVLHDPSFERTEAIWRSLHELITNVDNTEELTIHLVQASKAELSSDLEQAGGDLSRTWIYRLLVDDGAGSSGGEPWSVVIGDYEFCEDEADLNLLGAFGAIISRQVGGIFLSGAAPDLIGCPNRQALSDSHLWASGQDSRFENWRALRQMPYARTIGLTLPRVLLRQPYGKGSDEVGSFAFEEQTSPPAHNLFLWGNGAFLCARLLAQCFTEAEGWEFNPDAHLGVDGLPLWTYEENGQTEIQPVAEVAMPEMAASEMARRGVMTMCSVRNQNACRLLQFLPITGTSAKLSGSWSG